MAKASRSHLLGAIAKGIRHQMAASILFTNTVADRVGLNTSDVQFMNLLEVYGPLTPGRLAELTGLSTGTVTGILDRIEQAGFARRSRDPSDRRKVIVSLDQARIQQDIAPMTEAHARRLEEILASYDTEQLAVIADFLARITARDDAATEPAAVAGAARHGEKD